MSLTCYLWTLFLFFWAVVVNKLLEHYRFHPRTRTEEFLLNVFLGVVLALLVWHGLVWSVAACAVLVPLFLITFVVREALNSLRSNK